jgi:4-diphosphocytidyl-2-C-methyl-D-erythritol kinase
MISERYGGAVVVWAPAKVNLFLEVLGKRADGYHEIASLLIAVSLYDTLEFQEEPTGKIEVACDHPDLPPTENLVYRAAQRLRQHTGCGLGATIKLRKRIPLAAGLAGGSSDAAATLDGLNRLWRLGLPLQELTRIGAELGSDVPFFFATPAAWCTGRGEIVEPLVLDRPLWFVVASPAAGLPTAQVYARVAVPATAKPGDRIRLAVQAGTMEEVAAELHNRLEEAAMGLCPGIDEARGRLRGLQPAGVLISGSGSSVFALCHGRTDALRVAHGFLDGPYDGPRPSLHVVRSCI